jgi:hypothetical protein
MNRDQRNIEDELSQLKAEIQGNLKQSNSANDDEAASHRSYQRIDGNNNFQVGGHVTLGDRHQIDPNNPNVARCPQCHDLTYKYSNCLHCGLNLPEYFQQMAIQQEKERLLRLMTGCFISGMAIVLGTSKLFSNGSSVAKFCYAFGGILIFAGYMASVRHSKL